MRKLITLLVVAIGLTSCIFNQYVPFKPVYLRGDQLVASEEPLSAKQRENIKTVLKYYNVPYQEDKNGQILIPKSVWEDRDTVWNYTTKANDPAWLNSR
ncbi:MAG TPA: hypothetical protein VK184_12350 [Nostocaceae cyanobacterium]|nr:hypothetical protein [Nostocaceae cyanobacterium]